VSGTGPTSGRENNLDFLRLAAAFAVIVGHGYGLTGRGAEVPRLLGAGVHGLGLGAFFIISGYLITKSWLRRSHLGLYLAARSLRIFPRWPW
jgi:peptidoglycan/LPS O-acetylase OafA/YrhL